MIITLWSPTWLLRSFISPPKREQGKEDPDTGWSRASQKNRHDKSPLWNQKSFPRLPRELFLEVTNTSGDNTLINWVPSHEDKFVTKTRDQPEPGSSFPSSLRGGEVKDPGNKVVWSNAFQIIWLDVLWVAAYIFTSTPYTLKNYLVHTAEIGRDLGTIKNSNDILIELQHVTWLD